MKPFNCIIIEDEPLALERTRGYVERTPGLHLVATFDNALEGLHHLQTQATDLLFLDINMDELSGLDLLRSTSFRGEVILTTAYQQYALEGYELNVTDYLLKPFTFERFLQAVNKARMKLEMATATPDPDFVFIKTENRLEKVMVADILYIEGMRDYRRIHTTEKRLMTLQNFGELEQLLPEHRICRVHKSYMVALAHIEAIERGRILVADQRLPISATYKERFFQLISGQA